VTGKLGSLVVHHVSGETEYTSAAVCILVVVQSTRTLMNLLLVAFAHRRVRPSRSGTQLRVLIKTVPIPVAARSKTWVAGRALAGIVGSNPTGGMDGCLL
jgi:hypothetical protein